MRSTLDKPATKTTIQTPCRIAERRVRAPASILAELRTITPAMGSAPSRPQAMVADAVGTQLAIEVASGS